MVDNFDYIIPIAYVVEDNNSMIAKKEVTIRSCSGWNVPDDCDLWSSQKCDNDDNYCQPFVLGDIIYGQIVLPASYAGTAAIQIFDSATGVEIPPQGVLTPQIGKDADGIRYINYALDTRDFTTRCFYIKLSLWDCVELYKLDQEFTACVAAAVLDGVPFMEAIIQCADARCPDGKKEFTSEPYCLVDCGPSLIEFEAEYTKKDCDGYYYGDIFSLSTGVPAASIYKLKFRTFGSIHQDGYNFTRTEVDGVLTSIKRQNQFLVYIEKIPPYVAAQIARALGSKEVFIDGVSYTPPDKLSKDFPEGQSWIPKFNVFSECAEQDQVCE